MNAREILTAENLINRILKRNFIDDFCCCDDLGLNLDLTISNLTSGYRTALRELGLKFDDDEITEEQYNQAKDALDNLYNYYKQGLVNSMNKINTSNNNDSIRGEEFIELPDFIVPESPEASMYIEMYKKYFGDYDEDVPSEKKALFDRSFYEQIYGARLKPKGEFRESEEEDVEEEDIQVADKRENYRYVKSSKDLYDVFDDIADKIMGDSSGRRRL